MMSGIGIIDSDGIRDISSELLENNIIKLFPASHYKKYSWEEFRLFCHRYGRYGIPTTELISYIKKIINERSAIEIGSGAGDLGFHLGIKMTDSKLQEDPFIKNLYETVMQPTIKYPKLMEKIDALDAVIKYKPKVVIGSWISTYEPYETDHPSCPMGIKEKEILELVDTFIIIGNLHYHGNKPIKKIGHKLILEKWILSRAQDKNKNCIMIWNKND